MTSWGWAFAQDRNCDFQNVYLELTNMEGEISQYETKSAVRFLYLYYLLLFLQMPNQQFGNYRLNQMLC